MAMKITRVVLLTLTLITFILIPIAGCERPMRTQTYDFTDFTRVEVGSAFIVEIVQSESYSITITAGENLFDAIQVSKEGATLEISGRWKTPFPPPKAEIAMPDLRELSLSGATNGSIEGFSSSHDIVIDLSGSSELKGNVTAGDAQFTISGESSIELEGSAGDMDVNASGASHVELSSFPVSNAYVVFTGASSGTINLNGRLDANLSGASDLRYVGEPTMGNITTSGESTVSKK